MGDNTNEGDVFSEVEAPFARAGLGRRLLPFGAVAILAYASLALPPGPASVPKTLVAGVLLLVVAGGCWLPWDRLPSWLTVLVPLVYTASVLMLILAAGGSTSGVGIVILIPLVWTALYHRRWESLVVVLGIVAVEIVTSLTPVAVGNAVIIRRVIFWAAMGGVVSVGAHDLRDRVRRTTQAREEILRRTVALQAAAAELTAILLPGEIIIAATRLAAEVGSPLSTARSAQYLRVSAGIVTVVAQFDEAGESVTDTFPLDEHPQLQEVLNTRSAVHSVLDPATARGTVRELIERPGITHGIYVPLICNGEVDGVLSVPLRGGAVADQLFEQCKALGHLTELALSNATAHQKLLALATTDSLTGLPNRLAFERLIDNRPGRYPFAMLAMDLDGLKQVNDSRGHAAGDALLVHVASTINASLRRGDVLARLGGDEFAVLVFDARELEGSRAAERILHALAGAPLEGVSASVSIGIAIGESDSIAGAAYAAADAAMYEAKRRGGRQYALASSSPGGARSTAAPREERAPVDPGVR
ncbi:MAG: diguanylate cyclase domain-containing protein [Acidimicrobiales bacterium]